MTYRYPDKDDVMTVQLIENHYDVLYWGKSEDVILEIILEHIKSIKNKKIRMLDVGCGIGRLFATFAPYVGEIVALEPDRERFSVAKECSNQFDKVSVFNCDINSMPENLNENNFDVILSSHVFQHISHKMVEDLLLKMAEKLESDGLIVVTTTFTNEDKDIYTMETLNEDGKRVCQVIGEAEFDEVFSSGKALPVRLFSRDSMKKLANRCGLDVILNRVFHFKNFHSVSMDEEANRKQNFEGGRDALYLLRK